LISTFTENGQNARFWQGDKDHTLTTLVLSAHFISGQSGTLKPDWFSSWPRDEIQGNSSRALFFRFCLSGEEADLPVATKVGFTEKAIRFVVDQNSNVGTSVKPCPRGRCL
jgi:hypothetical protein